jgi:hypothetical protein
MVLAQPPLSFAYILYRDKKASFNSPNIIRFVGFKRRCRCLPRPSAGLAQVQRERPARRGGLGQRARAAPRVCAVAPAVCNVYCSSVSGARPAWARASGWLMPRGARGTSTRKDIVRPPRVPRSLRNHWRTMLAISKYRVTETQRCSVRRDDDVSQSEPVRLAQGMA